MGKTGPVTEAHTFPGLTRLRSMVMEAMDAAFGRVPDRHGFEERPYRISEIWPDRALLTLGFDVPSESTSIHPSTWGLLSFTVSESNDILLGDLVPVSIQAVPVGDDGEAVVLDEALAEAPESPPEKGDSPVTTASPFAEAIRSFLSALPKDLIAETLEQVKEKDPPSEEPTPKVDTVVEWAEMPGQTLTEVFEATKQGKVRITEADGQIILHDTQVLGPVSKNGRIYPVETMRKAMPLFEGAKAFLNHQSRKESGEPRLVQDFIGEHKNIRIVGERMISDLHLVNKPVVREDILPVAEAQPHQIGNSIVARGRIVRRDGQDVVEELLAVRSADLVAEPATTDNLFAEGVRNPTPNIEGESRMELKDLTLEQLRADRPDLLETFQESLASSRKLADLEALNADLQKQVTEANAKIATQELKDAQRAKADLIARLVSESTLPAAVVYEKNADGQQVIKGCYLRVLEACQAEDDMRTILADWEEAAKPPVTQVTKPAVPVRGTAPITEGSTIERAFSALVS